MTYVQEIGRLTNLNNKLLDEFSKYKESKEIEIVQLKNILYSCRKELNLEKDKLQRIKEVFKK